MAQRYVKVYPTTEDIGKTPTVVEDEEGVNGVGIEFARVISEEEMQGLLDKTAQIATNGQSLNMTGNVIGANVKSDNETRLTAIEDKAIFNQINVKDFGAVGNGVTDDTEAIQDALDIGGEIIFPQGAYIISAALTVSDNSILKGYGAKLKNVTTNQNFINLSSGCKMYGLTIEGAGYATYNLDGKGISIAGSAEANIENIIIKDCTIYNISSFGIYCSYANYVNIVDCKLYNLAYAGVGAYSCNFVNVDKCHIKNISSNSANEYGVTFTSANEVQNPRSQYCTVSNCLIEDVTDWEGLDIHGAKGCKFINNTIKGCSRGIVLKMRPSSGTAIDAATDCIVDNNIVYGGGNLGLYVNGTADAYAENNKITNNIFIDCGLDGQSAYEQGGVSCSYTKNTIVNNNIIINPYGDGIVMKRYNYGFVVSGNMITNVQNSVTGSYGIVSYVAGEGLIANNHIYLTNPSLNTYVGQVGISVTGSQNNKITIGSNNSNCTTPLSVSNDAVNYGIFGNTGAKLYAYAGTPEGHVTAGIGSLCINTSGGATTTLYIKESGANTNTGWVAK